MGETEGVESWVVADQDFHQVKLARRLSHPRRHVSLSSHSSRSAGMWSVGGVIHPEVSQQATDPGKDQPLRKKIVCLG